MNTNLIYLEQYTFWQLSATRVVSVKKLKGVFYNFSWSFARLRQLKEDDYLTIRGAEEEGFRIISNLNNKQ